MRATQKQWCNVCKFLTYGCRHEEREQTPGIFASLTDHLRREDPRPEWCMLPFTSTAPVAGASHHILTASPQILFKPRRLAVAPEIAAMFNIVDLRIGNRIFLADVGKVRASVFLPDNPDRPINNLDALPVVAIGQQVSLQIENLAPHAVSFSAAIFGHSYYVPPPPPRVSRQGAGRYTIDVEFPA